MKTLADKIEQFQTENNIFHFEGERGVESLCQIVRVIGYKDPMHRIQLSSKASLGDLMEFLSDNPGAIEAVVNWIGEQNVPEWSDKIGECLCEEEEDEDEDEDESLDDGSLFGEGYQGDRE